MENLPLIIIWIVCGFIAYKQENAEPLGWACLGTLLFYIMSDNFNFKIVFK